MPSFPLSPELTAIITKLWNAALSPSTHTVYQAGIKHFLHYMVMFNQHQGYSHLPTISEDCLIAYVAHCHGLCHLKYSTIKLYLCAIRFAYLSAGHRDPLTTSEGLPLFRLFTIMRGVKRVGAPHMKPRLPITFSLLRQLCHHFRAGFISPFLDLLMEVVCVVAFFGFLRCGEFTAPRKFFDPAIHLTLQDIQDHSNHITLNLKVTKTDPFRRGVLLNLYQTHHDICPVISVRQYLKVRHSMGSSNCDPLFITRDGVVLTRHVFLSHLKSAIDALSIDSKLYNGHSFRIGAATTASSVRMEDHLIRTLGRWSSDCYTRYIRTPAEVLQQAQQSLCHDYAT